MRSRYKVCDRYSVSCLNPKVGAYYRVAHFSIDNKRDAIAYCHKLRQAGHAAEWGPVHSETLSYPNADDLNWNASIGEPKWSCGELPSPPATAIASWAKRVKRQAIAA